MKNNKVEKLLLAISTLGLIAVVMSTRIPFEAWTHCIIISILLSITLSSMLQRSWRYFVQRKIEKDMSEKINLALKKVNRYRKFLNQISEGLIVVSGDGICQYANFSFCSLVGLVENEVLNSNFSRFIVSDLTLDRPVTSECILMSNSRKRIPVLISTVIISRGKNKEILICVSDLREIKNLEKKLQHSRELNSAAFKSSKAAILIIDAKSHEIINANESACLLTGYTEAELVGMECGQSFCTYKRDQCESRIAEGKSFSYEEEIIKKDGTHVTVLRNTTFVLMDGKKSIFETMIDISERKKAEELLVKSQRIESLGTLASGIAHEFNNINNIMKGAIDILFISDDEKEEVPPHIKNSLVTIKKMIERGATITNDLMVFASDSNDGCEKIELLELIESSVYEFRNEIEEFDIDIKTQIPKDILVFANKSELRSVLSNLISNAIHSLVDEEKRIISFFHTVEEDKVQVSVSDTGCGISQNDLQKVFDPFFSTKGVYAQSGTSQSSFESRGLGLSVCYTILEKHHNGKINIYSEPGKGTTVVFSLKKA